jgi:hypothetical protein
MRALVPALVAVVAAGCSVASTPPAPTSFVYGCVPVAVNSGGNYEVAVHVHNPGATNATVSRTPLNKDGANLAGTANPNGGTFPGEAGAATITILPGRTETISWVQIAGNPATLAGSLVATVKVTSSVPVAAAVNLSFSGFHLFPCSDVHP